MRCLFGFLFGGETLAFETFFGERFLGLNLKQIGLGLLQRQPHVAVVDQD